MLLQQRIREVWTHASPVKIGHKKMTTEGWHTDYASENVEKVQS